MKQPYHLNDVLTDETVDWIGLLSNDLSLLYFQIKGLIKHHPPVHIHRGLLAWRLSHFHQISHHECRLLLTHIRCIILPQERFYYQEHFTRQNIPGNDTRSCLTGYHVLLPVSFCLVMSVQPVLYFAIQPVTPRVSSHCPHRSVRDSKSSSSI